MKKIDEVNIALLLKWKWRILMENEAIWLSALKVRYEDLRKTILVRSNKGTKKYCSTWWKDLLPSNKFKASSLFSFSINVFFRIGDNSSILFWSDS